MDRREFLATAAALYPIGINKFGQNWRTFRLTTKIGILKPSGATRIWLPTAMQVGKPYQRAQSCKIQCVGGKIKSVANLRDSLTMISAEFGAHANPALTVAQIVSTQDWLVDLLAGRRRELNRDEHSYWLRPTKLIPTDGLVKEKALAITGRAKTDAGKARAIYEWIVENTHRNPQTRGCGLGNIRYMLESNDLGGKCADLNALYVGLARASGLPARDVYGIRVAPSRLGYQSLGPASGNVSKAQHCRAEVYLSEFGWVPVDPADVRKVILEEPPGNRAAGDALVTAARARLFGSWEGNWLAYNFAHDVVLPGSLGPALGFFMYPQAETADGRLDSLAPDNFSYKIEAEEIVS